MLNKIANVEVISKILPHPNADALEIAQVKGWQSVVKKGEHKEGDKVIFIYPDNEVKRASWNEFLFKNNNEYVKIKGIKLRGEYSSGLIVPISILNNQEVNEGDDVSELIGARKYEKPLPTSLQGKIKGNFPTHLCSKTDEILLKNDIDLLEELNGLPYYITEKMDGSSFSCYFDGENFGFCSRNLELQDDESNTFYQITKKYDLENTLKRNNLHFFIQGEVYGEGIQNNPLKIRGKDLAIFRIKDLKSNDFLPFEEIVHFCDTFKIPMVKVIEEGDNFHHTSKSLQDLANDLRYSSGLHAEGIVVRPKNYKYSQKLGGMLSFKVISELYKD